MSFRKRNVSSEKNQGTDKPVRYESVRKQVEPQRMRPTTAKMSRKRTIELTGNEGERMPLSSSRKYELDRINAL
jgi:hypothetical protein